jgi:hypothetical protein
VLGAHRTEEHYDLLALAESTMTITPGELLETSIAQLRTLIAFLGEQLNENAGGTIGQCSAPEVRACKDMLVSLSVLLQGSLGPVSGHEVKRESSSRAHRELRVFVAQEGRRDSSDHRAASIAGSSLGM